MTNGPQPGAEASDKLKLITWSGSQGRSTHLEHKQQKAKEEPEESQDVC